MVTEMTEEEPEMNQYVTGAVIRKLRESKKMTQQELADMLHVSAKAVSKWETGKGYPDISLVESLAGALGVSTIELLSGNAVTNTNRSSNILRSVFHVCPVCGNVIWANGESVVSCCGITLPPLEAEEADEVSLTHHMQIELVEDEYYVHLNHDMSKEHHISFIAAYTFDGVSITKLYPEGGCEARFKRRGTRFFCCYCNRHGLFKVSVPKSRLTEER